VEERSVGLQGQRHDPGPTAVGLGWKTMGVPRRGVGETRHDQGRVPNDPGAGWRAGNHERRSTAGQIGTDRGGRARHDDGVRLDGGLRGALDPVSSVASALPLSLVPPTSALSPQTRVSKPKVQLCEDPSPCTGAERAGARCIGPRPRRARCLRTGGSRFGCSRASGARPAWTKSRCAESRGARWTRRPQQGRTPRSRRPTTSLSPRCRQSASDGWQWASTETAGACAEAAVAHGVPSS
jgi:hypothetical protein